MKTQMGFFMFGKLKEVENHFEHLSGQLMNPEIINHQEEYQKLLKEHSEIKDLVETYRIYKKNTQELAENKELLEEDDEEIRSLAKEEIPRLEAEIERLSQELQVLLLPKDPNDDRNIYLEIRAGAGGDESSLFAEDLFKMYSRYAESKRWQVELLSASYSDVGGFKELVIKISGNKVYSHLKYEMGVHRVQRVPKTESMGRVHTSTCTVAVLPEIDDVEVDIKKEDLKIDVFRASGPGGQSVNTTDSAVRITHIPTGVVVVCSDEKSQHKNKAKALRELNSRILAAEQEKQAAETSANRKSQVGTGDRSEKIRTYNFPQSRITDHRIGLTIQQLDTVLSGKMDLLIEPARTYFQSEALKGESQI